MKIDYEETSWILHNGIHLLCTAETSNASLLKEEKVKLLHGWAPTMRKLHQRRPDLYSTSLCFRCEEAEEDTQHVFRCKEVQNELQYIKFVAIDYLTDYIAFKLSISSKT